jgi:hypothetical protein
MIIRYVGGHEQNDPYPFRVPAGDALRTPGVVRPTIPQKDLPAAPAERSVSSSKRSFDDRRPAPARSSAMKLPVDPEGDSYKPIV